MDGYQAYQLYKGVNLHFTSPDYDALKYNFGTKKVSKETYLARNDKFVFQRLAKLYPNAEELINFYVANYMSQKGLWPRDCTPEIYLKWLKINSALDYWFREDLEVIFFKVSTKQDFKALFDCSNVHPPIYDLLIQRKIKLESFLIFDALIPFIERLNKEIKFRTLWDLEYSLYSKYRIFVKYDKARMKQILMPHLEQLKDSNGIISGN